MSTFDDIGLAMIPSGYKASKLYSVLPNDGDGDFDFSRATSATRVNSQGLIEKERANLLLQSNSFNTTWTLDDVSVTSGQSGYDGSSDAWLLKQNTANSRHHIFQTVSFSGIGTFSIYAKEKELQYLQIASAQTTDEHANFDLSDGSIGNVGSDFIDAKATSVGDGWYRLSVVTTNGANAMYVSLVTSKTSGWLETYTGANATDGLFIQDAQLEQGLVATDYIETTTSSVTLGIVDDLPRLDYSGGASCPSLLLEPQRSNLVTQSEYFGAWTESGLTKTDNNATSPEGVLNAAKLTLPSGSATKRIALGSMPVTGVARSYSFFVKSDDITAVQLVHSGDLQGYARFDISTGVVGSTGTKTTSDIQDYGNGWYRCIANFDSSNAFGSTIYLYISDSATGGYGGSTSAEGDLFVYGAQYEEGSYPTSYIPTFGTSVTRNAEVCDNAGSSATFNDDEGVLFAEISALVNESAVTKRITISDGTSSNRITIGLSDELILGILVAQGSVNINQSFTYDTTQTNKIAFKYKVNDFSIFINGVKVHTDTSGNAFVGLNELRFDNGYSGSPFYGNTKQLIVFDEALSDEELSDLTGQINTTFNSLATFYGYTILS